METDNLKPDLRWIELDEYFDTKGEPVFREATVLLSELKHLAAALEEKAYRARYHGEEITLEWLAEVSEDAARMLRTAQEK